MFYTGDSMRGTFRPGDRLIFEPVTLADLHPGDVIVYRPHSPDGERDNTDRSEGKTGKQVVHRVIALTSGGAILHGDNNAPDDVELVSGQHIVGRVTHFTRDGKKRRVREGLSGLLRARIAYRLRHLPHHLWRRARALLRPLLQTPYRLLRWSRIIAIIWKPEITQITVQTPAGPLVKYIHRGRTVIEWFPERGRYHAVRPYDLIIFPPDSTTFPSELRHIDDP